MFNHLNTTCIHPSWQPVVFSALKQVNKDYLVRLHTNPAWLPGSERIFAAFSQPLATIRFVLMGESPYPRAASANGYAFWDNATNGLWSSQGLEKKINRATSLRNFIKMLLLAEHLLTAQDLSQAAITKLSKTNLIETTVALFQRMLADGFLLLNASLVLSDLPVRQDAKAWQGFIKIILDKLATLNSPPTLLLFGQIAHSLTEVADLSPFPKLIAPHPYNLSFITNPKVLHFFAPMHLLLKNQVIMVTK